MTETNIFRTTVVTDETATSGRTAAQFWGKKKNKNSTQLFAKTVNTLRYAPFFAIYLFLLVMCGICFTFSEFSRNRRIRYSSLFSLTTLAAGRNGVHEKNTG